MFNRKYIFGDTAVYYAETPVEGHEGKTVIGFAVYPADLPVKADELHCDSLVQAAFAGDENLIDYTQGLTMRNRSSTLLFVTEQTADETSVTTRLSDGAGNDYVHYLEYSPATGVLSVHVRYENNTGKTRLLEMLESFSISGIAATGEDDLSTRGLTLHRMTSAWSRECRLKSDSFSHLGLDMSWARYGVKCEKFGQRGTMPVRDYYPFAAIEDKKGVILGVTMEAPYSWQMEVYQEKETCALSGGLGDYEFAHWRKEIMPGECFETHKAFFAVKRSGGVNAVCNALLHEADSRLCVPESEEEMPVLFNGYCTTWGCPSEENIEAILAALAPFPIGYFMIDCGWYKPDDKGWLNAIGDWNQSRLLFPAGIARVVDKIRAAGMKAGVWFEFEVAGRDSECFERRDLLLTRDGFPLTSKNRRFLDLRKEEVKEYLSGKMLAFLKDNRFEYIKIDYNDKIGIGCDSADGAAVGEGGRQIAEESVDYIARICETVPGMVVENCSSGGSRIEPYRMSKVSMCSFSDAHECAEIPLVAANVSRVVPARQSQIWAVLREKDSLSRVIYSLCAAFIGRVCLSGDVLNLPPEKIKCISDGLDFYREVKDIVRCGDISLIDCDVEYYRKPIGRQIYVKDFGNRRLVIVHRLEGRGDIAVCAKGYRLERAFTDLAYECKDGKFVVYDGGEYRAGAFLLVKEA